MKIIFGLLIVSLCLIAVPVQAASLGLSPAIVDCHIDRGSSKVVEFTVIGYSGMMEISSEDMPVRITPASVNVIADSKIAVTIKCNSDAADGLYDGRIVFLAKNGNSVMSGVKVRCNLTVGNLSSPIVYEEIVTKSPTSSITVAPGVKVNETKTIPFVLSPPVFSVPSRQGETIVPQTAVVKNEFNWLFFGIVVVSGLLFVVLCLFGYKWIVNRKKI